VSSSLDDSFDNIADVHAFLKKQWQDEAAGEDIVIDDFEQTIADSRDRAIANSPAELTIPVQLTVLEPPFEVIDDRGGEREELILRSPPSKTLLEALARPSKGSTVRGLASTSFSIVPVAKGLLCVFDDSSIFVCLRDIGRVPPNDMPCLFEIIGPITISHAIQLVFTHRTFTWERQYRVKASVDVTCAILKEQLDREQRLLTGVKFSISDGDRELEDGTQPCFMKGKPVSFELP
jgi:hypothetical protein